MKHFLSCCQHTSPNFTFTCLYKIFILVYLFCLKSWNLLFFFCIIQTIFILTLSVIVHNYSIFLDYKIFVLLMFLDQSFFFLSKFLWINYALPGVFKYLHVCKCFYLPYRHMLSQVTTMGLQFCSLCKCLSPFFKVFLNILKSVLSLFPIYTWWNKAKNHIILPKSQNMIEPSSTQIPHPTLITVLF